MGTMIKVIDRRTEQERLVTHAAYAAKGPKAYQKLAVVEVDEHGKEISSVASPNSRTAQAVRNVKGAAPVVVRTQIVTPPVETTELSTPETTAETTVTENQAPLTPTTETNTSAPTETGRKKPGPKPGTKKSKAISSNSDDNAQ